MGLYKSNNGCIFDQSYKKLGKIQRNIYIFICHEATTEDKRNIYIL